MRNVRILLPLWISVLTLVCQQAALAAEEKPAAKEPAAISVKVTGKGRPMILIPGLGCGGNVWDDTVAHFKDRYQCHVLTLAGFAGNPPISQPILLKVHDAIVAYIDEKKLDHPVIVGHSMGGCMAFWVAETAPDKVGPIIAVDGAPFFPALWDRTATVESSMNFAEQMRKLYFGQTPEEFAAAFRGFLSTMITNPKNLDMVCTTALKSDPKTVGQAAYELMLTDLRGQVKVIKSPVLLIGATGQIDDPNVVATVKANYEAQVAPIATHKVVFAPKAKHFIQLDDPEFFYKEVDAFLKEADAKKGK
jgi:N-formylmaleamate deformylase